MPRRDDISKILLIGSGPIVIGQAAEFDYSGTQACKVLREEGYEVVLVNSNPATIMTDPEFADRTYVEPLTPEVVAAIIERERPDVVDVLVGEIRGDLDQQGHVAARGGICRGPDRPEQGAQGLDALQETQPGSVRGGHVDHEVVRDGRVEVDGPTLGEPV